MENKELQQDIASIRKLMERSVKFMSLSGLSGILAGTYALIGAGVSWYIMDQPLSWRYHQETSRETYQMMESLDYANLALRLGAIACGVLLASLITGYWLSIKKAAKAGVKVWDSTSRRVFVNLAVPLVSGGILILILLYDGYYSMAAPLTLLFYGLALLNASAHLYDEIRYLGYSEIILGLIAAAVPGYGLIFWAVGFGVLHIGYGARIFRKYDR